MPWYFWLILVGLIILIWRAHDSAKYGDSSPFAWVGVVSFFVIFGPYALIKDICRLLRRKW